MMQFSTGFRFIFTVLISFYAAILIGWQYWHGGVDNHYLLQSDDMPAMSNWWGLVLLPLLSWWLLGISQRQLVNHPAAKSAMVFRFAFSLLFGAVFSLGFEFGYNDELFYLLLSLPLLALLWPLYRPEFLIGMVLAMTITFGMVIPVIFAIVVVLVTALVHCGIRPLLMWGLRQLKPTR